MDNENLTLNVYDDDTFDKTPVYSITFDTIDAHKTGFYHPFTITEDVITKIKESGTADYGDLYFNIVRNNVDLQIRNGDQKLGEFLKVTLDPKIINAYFCDANDTQQVLISALNGALYFKIYAINMVDKKVEINFLTESDAYWSWKDELELDDYEDIKKKFSDERIIDTTSATFNNKGEILVPVNLSKIGKPKNFIRLNAIVKIIAEKKEEAAQKKELGFYMIHKDLTLLYPPATLPNMAENNGAVMVGREQISGGGNNCGGKFCIKKDSQKSELIREVNIRLAGFGGNVPADEFTERTEKMIKQFQRDYMKAPETGKICGNVLKAIDEFQSKHPLNFSEIKCKCGKCTGFGKDRNSEEYQNTKILEKHRKYEYPGVHRSLLWCYRASIFYVNRDTQLNYKTKWVESGYRCHDHYIYIRDKTTNHCGKALDIHYNFLSNGKRADGNSDMNKVRKEIFMKYCCAKQDWNAGKDIFYLESFATTWVHVDVREFSQEYLTKNYFVTNSAELDGKSIVTLANELGFKDLCSCGGEFSANNNKKENGENKYKWAHSAYGNMIAEAESSDNYNICNKTVKVPYQKNGKTHYKRVVEVVDDLILESLTLKEIQKKQTDKDLFAVGRYQVIPNTLNTAISSLGLDLDEKLTTELQDKIFDEYLIKVKRPKIIAYLEGDGSVEDAMYASAQEWASLAVEKDKKISSKKVKVDGKETLVERFSDGTNSYYMGDGLNKAHVIADQVKNDLINSKSANK
ncbi:hypothetical protein [Kaistella carnis]|uniref:hypothetical protein n=3 Tax=Kaistella carnis TaxID=1241979 RepID=UPI0028A6F5D0|nr:hypothetical protein [Kaistella carnis]